jgi:hypothetical protein
MIMIVTAAIRSPKILIFRDMKEVDNPVAKSRGTVPSPKKIIVKNPSPICWYVAAFRIMDHDNPQGRKPVARPRTILEPML